MVRILATILLLALLGIAGAHAQGIAVSENIAVASTDTLITLSHEFILPGTLILTLDGVGMVSAADYSLDPRFGTITFGPALRATLAAMTVRRAFTTTYSYRPIILPRSYYRRRLVTIVDSAGGRRQVAEERTELTGSSIFGKNFQRSGVLARGFTVGSNRDLTLQSSLRLQFSGNIADSVEVLGALTDEQTPIQPEGNTQTLQEIDNVFIEVRSPIGIATLGKFIADNQTSNYTSYSRKLQGGRGLLRYGEYGSLEVVAAVSPGKFTTQQLQGRERDQGPYRLTGVNNERNIVVVAGTERVWVDGVAMVRGENNDYVIDYGTAEIFFQTRRPITSASRITVDFEYTDRQYSRSFIALNDNSYLFDSVLMLTAGFVREADNPDATIDLSLNEADRALLMAAGGDRMKAVRSGATISGRTDSVKGAYVRIDTVINGLRDSIFRYSPDDPMAIYNVSFSVPPDEIGDYRYVAFGQFEYAGKGEGSYLPVVYLPLPELRQVASLGFRTRRFGGVELNGEAALSMGSANRFSDAPEARLAGGAFTARALAANDSIRIAGADLGALRFAASAQYIGADFQAVDRLGEVEFNNRWNVNTRPGEGRIANFILEDSLSYYPLPRLALTAANGYLSQGGDFFSLRQQYSAAFAGDTSLPSADYTFELISTDTLRGARRGRWYRQRGGISQMFGFLTPGLRFEYEHREDRAGSSFTDTLYPSSFTFLEGGPDLRVELPFMITTASARYRLDDSVRYDSSSGGNRFLRDGISQTYHLRGDLRGVRNLTSSLEFTYRLKKYDSIARIDESNRLNKSTILARSQTRWSGFDRGVDLDALYDVQTEQAARLQRLFIRVPFGQGEYSWTDLDSNGRQSTEEFRLALPGEGEYVLYDYPTEQLYPVIDLRTSFRLRVQPNRFLDPDRGIGWLLAPITAETYLALDEKSQSEHESDIYLLRLGSFQNDSTTLLGNSTIQQDLNFFEANPEYSFRLRYADARDLARLVSTIERTRNIERSLRVRWHPTFDIGLQLDLASNSRALRSTDSSSRRTFDLTALSATNDFSYRPEQSIELGWILKLSSSLDILPATPRTTLLNTNEIRAIYSIETRGRITLSVERTNVSGTNIGGEAIDLPYQLTEGYEIGTTWIGRASVEYRFGSSLQISVNYVGRAQPPSMKLIHTGQAEVRAFF